jgi:hypothetical protein
MDYDILMYGIHWAFAIGALLFSWNVSQRQFLHPHFMFTVMLCVFLSDFLVRGYTEDRTLIFIGREDVYRYQIMILTILTIIVCVTALFQIPDRGRIAAQAIAGMRDVTGVRPAIYTVIIVLLGLELLKRFSTVGWSLDEVISQSLNARGERDWDQASYTGNFLFALVQIFLPLGGIAAAYLSAGARGTGLAASFGLFGMVLIILVTDGSRTPVAVSYAALALFWMLKQHNIRARLVPLTLSLIAMAATFSLMYLNRASGYHQQYDISQEAKTFELTYDQDDSIYRAIYAYAYSDQTGKSWDAIDFFFSIIVNPIPRAFWPSKPALDANFYDGFKLDYVTNMFLGEMVAMTGPVLSLIFSPLVGVGIYLFLFKALNMLNRPLGLVAYLLVALYAYQCMRSLPNLVMFCYMPGLAVLVSLWLGWRQQRQILSESRTARLAFERRAPG